VASGLGSSAALATTVTLPVFEFIDRFLMHVLPKGLVKVRYCGFYVPGARKKLALVRDMLAADEKLQSKAKVHQADVMLDSEQTAPISERWRPCCPQCRQPMILTGTIEKRARCPPG